MVRKRNQLSTRTQLLRLALVLFDVAAVNLSYFIALLVRFYVHEEFNEQAMQYIPAYLHFTPFYTVGCIAIFYFFKMYNSRWRYAGWGDLNRIFYANLLTCVLQIAGSMLFVMRMPVTYYFIGAVVQVTLITVVRLAPRIILVESEHVKSLNRKDEAATNAMVVGAGETAHVVLRSIEADSNSTMKAMCAVDFRANSSDARMDGIPVIGGIEAIPAAVKKYAVENVILADPSMPGIVRKRVREICDDLKLDVQDYVGYFQESWGSMTLSGMITFIASEVELVINGVHRICVNGKQAAQYITAQHVVKAMYAKDNRFVVELQTPLVLMYITNNPMVAQIAEKNGVQRIWIDLETLGKEERQKNMNTVKSHHCIHDIEVISNVLTASELLVRVNPINPGSEEEINQVIAAGADMIMLPMWKSVDDVKLFLKYVNGRVKTTLLLETREAVECLDEVLKLGGFDEIHIGLNDLHLSYGLTFMFELLADGTVESLCKKIAAVGIPYGFGGIARIGEGTLPAERIVEEHYRLGSTRAILSRSFCNAEQIKDVKKIEVIFAENVARLRDCERNYANASALEFEENRKAVKRCVAGIVSAKKERMMEQQANKGELVYAK